MDGVEINPIIADTVMRDRFLDFSGRIYTNPRVRIEVDDGRSFVRRTPERYDVIQASLVDTWAATAAGAYTLTENTLYTVDAFSDYLDHLNDGGRADDYAVGRRWSPAGLARRGGVRAARLDGRRSPRDRAPGSGRDVPAEEDALQFGGNRAAAKRFPAARIRRSVRAGARRSGGLCEMSPA